MTREADQARTRRFFLPLAIALGLMIAGGVVYYRRGLNEDTLLAAGKAGLVRSLKLRSVDVPFNLHAVPKSRKAIGPDTMELAYVVDVPRRQARNGRTIMTPAATSGWMTIPIKVTVGKDKTPDNLGFERPVWAHQNAEIDFSALPTHEELWSRIDDELENVSFENELIMLDHSHAGYLVIKLAVLVRSADFEVAADMLTNISLWQPGPTWTPEWALRLEAELARFDKDYTATKPDRLMDSRVRYGLNYFHRAPYLSPFRRYLVDLKAR